MRTWLVLALVACAAVAEAQTVTGARFTLTTGPCTIRSGSGAPASGLGVVCDVYLRTDSPYSTYRKTGASTWTLIVPEPGTTGITTVGALGTGSITSGFGAIDVGSDGITGGTLTGTAFSGGTFSGTTGTFSTSVTTPTLTASGNLTLSPTGDVVLAPTGNDILPNTGYTKNIGALTNKYLTLHAAELWVETLVAQNTIATIGGRILVGPTTTLTSDLASGATSMSVKHNQISSGDRVVLQVNNQVEWIAVTSGASGAGPYTYSIARNQDGSGANDWTAGDAVFNTGTTGNGYIDLYSVAGLLPGSTAGPTIVGNVRLSGTYSDVAPRWAIGNLNGLYGYGATTYGTAFGDPSATNITIDATNGFRIRSSTTDKFKADTSGNLSITGDLSVGTSGLIRSGATSYASGTGYIFEYNGGTPRGRIGTTAANRVTWDGTDLTVVSDTVTIDTNGIKIASWNTLDTSCPGSCQDLSRAYAFSPASAGFLGLQGLVGTVSGEQALHLINDISGGSAPFARTLITAESTSIDMDSSGSMALTASTGVSFGNDLTVFQNNGTTSSNPYIRSNGSYVVLESRTNANGGGIYIANDNAADVYIGVAGGNQYFYAPNFQSVAPNWVTSLSQTTVGAAGAASALPATPAGYVKIKVNGTNLVIPAYNP
jgi:hypothetical protein